MWVFTELDNVEYVLVKYELGYASLGMTCRALDNFASKCERVRFFAESAETLVGREVGSGFLELTQKVVAAFARDVPFQESGAAKGLAAPAAAQAAPGKALAEASAGRAEANSAGAAA